MQNELLIYRALRFSNKKYYEMGNRASRLLAFQLRKAQATRIVPEINHPVSTEMVFDSPGQEQKLEEIGACFQKWK